MSAPNKGAVDMPSPKKTARRSPKAAPAKPRARKSVARAKKAAKPRAPVKAATKQRFSTGPGGDSVQEWLANVKAEHREIATRFDRIVQEELPGVVRAIKWNSPFYGLPGHGWVAAMASLTNYVKIGFFGGADLQPPPPVGSVARGESGRMRYVHFASPQDIDERQLRSWLRQSRDVEGWRMASGSGLGRV